MTHVPPPGFELINDRELTRAQWQAIERAHQLDCEYFRQNPLRLTRVRRAFDGETEHAALFPGKRCFVVVRQVRPDAHHKLSAFTHSDLAEAASSESAASELYDLMLADEQWNWSTELKREALSELLAATPVRGEA
jgi:hypothetical protein